MDYDRERKGEVRAGLLCHIGRCEGVGGSPRWLSIKSSPPTLVDSLDYHVLKDFMWCKGAHGYPISALGGGTTRKYWFMHRLITSLSTLEVDHINGNKLDNRRCNLRLVTRAQQMQNRRKFRRGRSTYKGVQFPNRSTHGFAAYVQGKLIGTFATEIEAAGAYDAEAFKRYGSFARFNFPEHYPTPTTNINWPIRGSFVTQALDRLGVR